MKKTPPMPKMVKKDEAVLFGGRLFKWLRVEIGRRDNTIRIKEARQAGICTYSLIKKREEGKFLTLDPFLKCGERTPMKESDLLKAAEEAVTALNEPLKEERK